MIAEFLFLYREVKAQLLEWEIYFDIDSAYK